MVQLSKGENIVLDKIQNASVGLSWDPTVDGVDLDVMAIELDSKDIDSNEQGIALGKALSDNHLVFYNSGCRTSDGKPTDPEHAIIHSGDNRDGSGEGDDEVMTVDFSKLNPRVNAILFVVNIYQARERGQNFGQVKNPKARFYYNNNQVPDIVFELDEDFSGDICIEFVMLYKHGSEWKFKAVGKGNKNGLLEELRKFGIPATGNA